MKFLKIIFFLLILLPFIGSAEDIGNQVVDNAENSASYLDTGEWYVSIAVGVGTRTNPLVGGDNLPLVILPDIAYYGEYLYFDNGDFGYTFSEDKHYSLSVLTHLNVEKSYFSFLHSANLLFPVNSEGIIIIIPPDELIDPPSIDDIANRKYALDLGLSLNVYINSSSLFRFQIMKDISDVYKGENALIEYVNDSKIKDWNLTTSMGVSWKSQKLIDYYYGIDARDNVNEVFYYQGKSSLNPFIKFSAMHPINERWKFVTFARYEKLGGGITNSVLVKDNSVSSFYMGASYAF